MFKVGDEVRLIDSDNFGKVVSVNKRDSSNAVGVIFYKSPALSNRETYYFTLTGKIYLYDSRPALRKLTKLERALK